MNFEHWVLPTYLVGFVLSGFVGGIFLDRWDWDEDAPMVVMASLFWPIMVLIVVTVCVPFLPVAAGCWLHEKMTDAKQGKDQ